MNNFEYFAPTKIVFGKNAENAVAKLIKEQNCTKVLVHFGGGSVKKSGLLDKIYSLLDDESIDYISLGGVVPNPRMSKVYEGIELCRKHNVDFILAVGGGSVIDSAKAIGYGMANDCDVSELYRQTKLPCGCMGIGVVLTISAAGSEMSNSSVITMEENWLKRACNSNYARAKFACLNPELTYTLPKYQTMSGITDILMHTMERYFTTDEPMDITDEFAEGLMRTVIKNAKILLDNPTDYNARAEIMWCSSLSHNDITGLGITGDWACHQLEHELGGMFDVAHGAGLASVFGSFARYVYKTKPERFAKYAKNVFGISDLGNDEKTALAGIEATENFYRLIGMPTNIKELGLNLSDDETDVLAFKCSNQNTRTIGNFRRLSYKDIRNIYNNARK